MEIIATNNSVTIFSNDWQSIHKLLCFLCTLSPRKIGIFVTENDDKYIKCIHREPAKTQRYVFLSNNKKQHGLWNLFEIYCDYHNICLITHGKIYKQ